MRLGKIGLERMASRSAACRFRVRALRLQSDTEIGVGWREAGLGGDDVPVARLGVARRPAWYVLDGGNEELPPGLRRPWRRMPGQIRLWPGPPSAVHEADSRATPSAALVPCFRSS